jgi:hypothetical protein
MRRSRTRLWGSLAVALALPGVHAETPAQERDIHGADSIFTGPGLTIVWAVQRGAREDESIVVTRIVDTAGRWRIVSVEGVDPFTGRRAPIADGLALDGQVDVRSPRRSFEDFPRREIRLYATREDWSAGKVALSVYYLGVPDTTPEFVLEASMLSYLAAASSARR